MILDEVAVSLRKKRGNARELVGVFEDGRARGGIALLSIPSMGAVAGHLSNPWIYDVANDIIYNLNDFPVALPVGSLVEGSVVGWNDSGTYLDLMITVWLEDPNGVSRGTKSATRENTPPGRTVQGVADEVTLDIAGDWILHAKLEG